MLFISESVLRIICNYCGDLYYGWSHDNYLDKVKTIVLFFYLCVIIGWLKD